MKRSTLKTKTKLSKLKDMAKKAKAGETILVTGTDNTKCIDEPVKINYEQLIERLKFFYRERGSLKLCANMSEKEYNPVDICGSTFFLINDEAHRCYTVPRKNEIYSAICICTEHDTLTRYKCGLNDKVLINNGNGKVFTVCGVYLDEDKHALVLMNNSSKGDKIDWNSLGIGTL